jgi:flagellar hook-associated protein 3 FlgL
MRIATANVFDRTLDTLQRRQAETAEAQDRLASGKRVQRASDDPTAAARAERALAQAERAQASQRALEASRSAMVQAESALGDATGLVQQARDLVVQAGNAALGAAQRATIAQALRGIRAQLLGIANQADGSGGYLFGGQGAATPPFADAAGGVQYRGVPGQQLVAAGEPLPITLDGDRAWMRVATGNGVFATAPAAGNGSGAWIDAGRVSDPAALTGDDYDIVFSAGAAGTTYAVWRNGAPTAATAVPYVAGRSIEVDGIAVAVSGAPADGDRFRLTPSTNDGSVFGTLDRLAAELGAGGRSGAQVAQTVSSGLRDLDQGLARLIAERAGLGETLMRTDAVEERIAESRLQADTERSAAEDADLAAAVSDFQTRQTGYDAALKAYSMVQRLSLFEYIG